MSNHGLVMKFEKVSLCSDVWHEIFFHAARPSPFLSHEWFLALCNHLLITDPEVMIFYRDNQPVGIFPGMIENGTLQFYGDERVTDIIDILFLRDYGDQIIEELASLITTRDLHLNLFPVESDSLLIERIPECVKDVVTEHADPCPILPLPGSWEGYLNNLDGKSRHELRRKLRKAPDIEIKSIAPEQIDILLQLMSVSDRNKKSFLTKEMCDFFKVLAKSFFKNQWLRLRATFIDARPCGALFSFQTQDHIYLFNTGFDPDVHSLSPGIVTIALDIKSAIDEGMKYYDFLRGGEDYKFRFGAKQRFTMRMTR